MRKRRPRDTKLLLNFACHHAGGMSGEEETHDLQARFGAESRKTVGTACDKKSVRLGHISIIAEIRLNRNSFFYRNASSCQHISQ